jgi:hypothetical protein
MRGEGITVGPACSGTKTRQPPSRHRGDWQGSLPRRGDLALHFRESSPAERGAPQQGQPEGTSLVRLSQVGAGSAVVAPLHDDTLLWDDPGRKWDVEIRDKEAANLVARVVKENSTWQAAKAREIAGLHNALGLPWPPKDDEASGEG